MINLKRKKTLSALIFSISLMMLWGDEGNAASYDAPPTGAYYYVKSVQAGSSNMGYWDQPGRLRTYRRGTNIAVWARDNGTDQQFRFIPAGGGWYKIVSRNGGYVNVDGGRSRNGTNIEIWSRKTRSPELNAQRFRFRHMGNGKWKIYTHSGRAICLAGRSHRNRSNVHIWNDHNGSWMEWYLINYRTNAKYAPAKGNSSNSSAGEIAGKLASYDFDERGRKRTVNPGMQEIEAWYFDRKDRKTPYKKVMTARTDIRGKFSLGKKFKDYETLFLLSKSSDRASGYAALYPKRGKTTPDSFISEKYSDPGYVLVDTKYRGKQYYYEKDGYFYRKNGKVTRRYDFFFKDITRINRSNGNARKLLAAIGGGNPARTDNDIALRLKSVLAFFKTKTKSSMGQKSGTVSQAADYMFRNCRKTSNAPVNRWPSFQEMADTYAKYGFIPLGNCTANSQVAATLLYVSGVPADKFIVSKFHYDMSWYVEHWVLGVNIGKRWYSIDPQHNRVIRINSAKDFERAYWERYISGSYDYKKPFEAWVLPGSKLQAVPYLGDPAELKKIIAERNKPVFFIKNRKLEFTSGGMVFRSKGTAVVKKISGNEVYLHINSVTKGEGPRGMETRKNSYDMKITFKNGVYSTGTDYVHAGKVDSTGKTLSMSGGQSGMTFKVK